MVKSNFIVRGGADFTKIKQALTQTQTQLKTFQNNTNKSLAKTQASIKGFGVSASKLLKSFGVILSTVAIGNIIKSSTRMAMSVESAMDNIQRNMGDAVEAFDEFAKSQAKYLGMAKRDAYAYGSTFSNLLGSFLGDTQKVASETQNLMKAAAVIASKTGRTYQDVSERIRSGMLGSTEAIEDLGIYTQVSMLEATDAFKKFSNGKSWNQLTFQQQQQIRLAAILEQTYKRYGDTLADTTQTKQARFLASLENIKLNLGQAFLPIYNAILPALTAFLNKLEQVTARLAVISESIFGKATSIQAIESQTEAITDQGNAIEKAGKQVKKSLASFDQLNILQSPSGDSGGESTTTTKPKTPQEAEKTINKVNSIFGKLQQKFPVIFDLAAERARLTKEMIDIVADIASVFRSDTAKQIGENLRSIFSESFEFILEMSLRFGNGFMDVIITTISNNKENLKSVLNDTLSATQTVTGTIRDFLSDVFDHIRKRYDEYIEPAIDNFGEGFNTVFTKISGAYAQYLAPTIEEIAGQFSKLVEDYTKPLAKKIIDFGGSVIELISKLYKHISPFVGWIGSFVVIAISNALRSIWEIFEFITKVITTRLESIFGVLHGLTEFLNGVFSGDWDRAWGGIRKIIDSWWKGVTSLFSIIKETITNNFGDAIEGAKNLIDSGLKSIKTLFSTFMEQIGIIISPFKNVFKGAINGVIELFNRFVNTINNNLKFSWDGLKIAGKTIFEGGSVQLAKLPTIPKLASGGLAYGSTLAMVGDNKNAGIDPEVIAPLSKLENLLESMFTKIINQQQRPTERHVYKVGETELAEIIVGAINTYNRKLGYTGLEV
ncbi:MAG TPA: hypothetical protein P5252_05000 [Candidatus Cloacimonas sp.]|nr:hypothetical protein [Candidatus Cloacimonas sp.]